MAEDIKGIEFDSSPLVWVKKSENEITPDDLVAFEQLVETETKIYKSINDRSSPAFDEQGVAALTHAFTHKVINDRMQGKEGLRVIFAKKGHQLIGYSVASVERPSNTVDDTFLGVSSRYQQQGLGSALLKARHEDFKSLGIASYRTRARALVLKLYDKLGVPYKIIPEPEFSGTSGKKVQVDIP